MEWFHKFVERIYKIWSKNGDIIKEANKKDTGDYGEYFVLQIIATLGYLTELSPFSKTPADVWGFILIESPYKYLHIAMIQVKSSESDKPNNISEDEKTALTELAKLVRNEFMADSSIKEEIKKIPLVISWGYMGVINAGDDSKEPISIKSGYQIGIDYPKDYFDTNFRIHVGSEVFRLYKK